MKTWMKIVMFLALEVIGLFLRVAGVIVLGYILSFIGSCGVLIILTSWLNSTNRK